MVNLKWHIKNKNSRKQFLKILNKHSKDLKITFMLSYIKMSSFLNHKE